MILIRKKKLFLPNNVNFTIIDGFACFNGPIGSIKHEIPIILNIYVNDNFLYIDYFENAVYKDFYKVKSLLNTTYSLFKSYISGVVDFFSKNLILKGIGYKVEYDAPNNRLIMTLGYSHPVFFNIPDGVLIEVPNNSEIIVRGISKFKVGQVASDIKNKKYPEIYKGNGIRYKNEIIKLKQSKKSK